MAVVSVMHSCGADESSILTQLTAKQPLVAQNTWTITNPSGSATEVVFDIFEDQVFAYDLDTAPDAVAAFSVVEHVDIVREYDDNTGRECIRIDWTTRPWQQREYMIVNWTKDTVSRSNVQITDDSGGLPGIEVPTCSAP